jgi:hypothetical protein
MVEALAYRLTHRGRPAGRLLVRTGERGRVAVVEARLQLQGVLGGATITQNSRCHADRHHSLRWRETTEGRADGRPFDVVFDPDAGLVTATVGRHDTASVPYLLPYRDPLSLVRELRAVTAAASAPGAETPAVPWRIPLLGKDVVVSRIVDVDMEHAGGRRLGRGYVLHPGGSFVVIDLAPPHVPLKLVQRLPEGVLEALLVEISTEDTMPGLGDGRAEDETVKSSTGRRRPRRRRRGRGRG